MTTSLVSSDESILGKFREEYETLRLSETNRSSKKKSKGLLMSQVLNIPSLSKFRDFLHEANLWDFVDRPSLTRITLIAPLNEAFEAMESLIPQDLSNENRADLIRALARAHIVAAPSLFRTPNESSARVLPKSDSYGRRMVDFNYDLNGREVEVDLLEVFSGDLPLRTRMVNRINGVRPIAPDVKGISTGNGSIFVVPRLLMGSTFLEQKYTYILKSARKSAECTLWEIIANAGCTKFLALAERAGVRELLMKPAEPPTNFLNLLLPVNEAFSRIDESRLENDLYAEHLVKQHIFTGGRFIATEGHYNRDLTGNGYPQFLGELPHAGEGFWDGWFLYGAGNRGFASNGEFYLYSKCFFPDKDGWSIETSPRSKI